MPIYSHTQARTLPRWSLALSAVFSIGLVRKTIPVTCIRAAGVVRNPGRHDLQSNKGSCENVSRINMT
jgi:hypothetical protein